MHRRNNSRGFTLPEILITMGIVAIVLSTAVPGIGHMVKDNRLATQLNSIVTHVHMARAEAAKRDVRVIICRSNSPNASNPVCSGAEKVWTTGYIIFADDGNYSNNTYNAGTDTLLFRGQPATTGVKLNTSWSWNKNLEFNPDGSTNEGGAIAIMSLCDDRGTDYGRQIQISPNGISRMIAGNIPSCYPS